MGNAIGILLSLGIPLLLLILGLLIGSSVEAAHLRRLAVREQALSQIVVSDLKRLPANWRASEAVLVAGEAVVATGGVPKEVPFGVAALLWHDRALEV